MTLSARSAGEYAALRNKLQLPPPNDLLEKSLRNFAMVFGIISFKRAKIPHEESYE